MSTPMTPLRYVVLALCAGAVFVIWPLWPPLLLAAWTAALTRPLLLRFERGLKGRRRAAAVLSLLIFVVLALPLGLMILGIVSGARELIGALKSSPSATGALQSLLSSSPETTIGPSQSYAQVVALLQRSGAQGFDLLSDVAGAAATGLIGLFIYFGAAYALLVDSAALWDWLERHSPLEVRHLDRLADAFHETGRGLLVGVGLTTATQGLASMIIYFALGVPRAWVLGPITGIASVIPLVGSGLVWGPIAVGLFLTDHTIKGVVLLVLGVGVISVIDNLLRPIYARMGSLKMPMILLFVAVFGGLTAFGTWGALIGPLLVRLAMEALAIANNEEPAPRVPAKPGEK
jgi:predicted PurR-regulated permease PerM